MSSNSFPHLQKSAPRLPRAASGLVAQTNRAKSGVSPVCPECHDFLPRAHENSAGGYNAQITPELHFSSLFLVVAVRANRANTITAGVSSRHDPLRGSILVVALVAEGHTGGNEQLAHSASKPREMCPGFAASPVAVKSNHYRQIAGGVGAISSAQTDAERPSNQRDLRRPSTGKIHPGRGSFPGGSPVRWRRRPESRQQNSLKSRLTRLTGFTRRLTRRCPPALFSRRGS
jgi:hypothetical protein